jgi:hypothetical protein
MALSRLRSGEPAAKSANGDDECDAPLPDRADEDGEVDADA